MLRNLFYSVFATKHSDEWRLNIEKLSRYVDVFNARKIVVIRSDESTHDPAEVEKAFSAFKGVEFTHRRNSPVLGEAEGFIEDFAKLYSLRDDEMTFYAHTKGVKVGLRFIAPIRAWRDAMYWSCLHDVSPIEHALQTYACAGAFRALGIGAGRNKHGWHYSGTFWWVLHEPLFTAPNWDEIQNNRYGVENYLSDVFPRYRSFCTHFDGDFDLYAPSILVGCGTCGLVRTRAATWVEGHAGICTACGGYTDLADGKRVTRRAFRSLRRDKRRSDKART